MGDLLYLLGTLGFFAAMLGYVRALRRLGERSTHEEPPMSAESLIGLIVALAVLVYLMYSLLRPERF